MIFPDAQRVYRTIHNQIQTLWDFNASKRQSNNLNILTGFICGIIQSKQVKLADIVGDIPTAGKEESRIMQLKRWLKNEAVNVELFYLLFIERLLYSLSKQTLVIAIGGSTVARGCISLFVSMIWTCAPFVMGDSKRKKGHFPE